MPGQMSLFAGKRQRGRKPPPASEFALHCLVADTLKRWLSPDWRAFHVPNGEKRDPATAGRLKRMLVSPGVSDFILFGPGARVHALELKRRGEKPTPAQAAFLDAVRVAGGEAAWTASYEEALGILQAWGAVLDRVVLVENGDIVVRRASA